MKSFFWKRDSIPITTLFTGSIKAFLYSSAPACTHLFYLTRLQFFRSLCSGFWLGLLRMGLRLGTGLLLLGALIALRQV